MIPFNDLRGIWESASAGMSKNSLEDATVLTFPWILSNGEIEIRSLIVSPNNQIAAMITFNTKTAMVSFDNFSSWGDFSKSSIEAQKAKFNTYGLKDYTEKAFAFNAIDPIVGKEIDFGNLISFVADIRFSNNDHVRALFESILSKRKELVNLLSPKSPESKNDAGNNYRKYAELRSNEIATTMKQKWRSLDFDQDNPLQVEIAKRLFACADILLVGETGIGKTWNPSNIAKRNGIPMKMIQFTQNTDSVDLHGVDVIRQGLFDKEPSMCFRYGQLSMAFMESRDLAKEGTPSMVILDELLRARDQSSLISSLSVSESTNEYVLSLPNVVDYVMLKNNTNGATGWFAVTDVVDDRMTWIKMSGDGIGGEMPKHFFVTKNLTLAAEMHSRGDLPTIRKDHLKNIPNAILATGQKNEEIRVPQRAVAIIATSNVGEHYDVGMTKDNALFRRLRKTPVLSPPIPFMIERSLSKVEFSNDDARKKVQKILTKFLTSLDKRAGKEIATTARVNFGTVDDIIEAIDLDDPFKTTGFGNVYDAMKSKAYDFVDLDSDSTAEGMMVNPALLQIDEIVEVVRSAFADKNAVVDMTSTPSRGTAAAPSRGSGARRSAGRF
ncbi:MAG: AAA family ATPase [Paludibacter sp.]|nr:AAA family ATPase [Paludibacter sp.]